MNTIECMHKYTIFHIFLISAYTNKKIKTGYLIMSINIDLLNSHIFLVTNKK